jgi:hypothetical protein
MNVEIPVEVQYQQAYESWRQHDRFIWQMPSVVMGIAIAATTAAWAIETMPWMIRELIIAGSLILTIVMFFTLIKHRFFIDAAQLTLLSMERAYAKYCVQRLTDIEDDVYKKRSLGVNDFWSFKEPKEFQKRSAHRTFKFGIYFLSLLLAALLIVNPMLATNKVPVWSWWVYAGAIVITSIRLWRHGYF